MVQVILHRIRPQHHQMYLMMDLTDVLTVHARHYVQEIALLFVRLGLVVHVLVVVLNALLIVLGRAEKNVIMVVQTNVLVAEENASEDAHLVMDVLVV